MPVQNIESSQYSVDSRVLKGYSDQFANIIRPIQHVQSIDGDSTAGRTVNSSHHKHQCSLARTIWSEKTQYLPILNVQREFSDSLYVAEFLASFIERDHC